NGLYALYSNTTGTENTAMGVNADRYNATSTDMTSIGYDTCGGRLKLHNATAIGARATVNVSNALVLGSVAGVNGAKAATMVGIGTTSPTNLLTLGRGFGPSIADGWTTYSSRRWKTNIHLLQNALSKVEQLRGVSYDLKDSGKHEIGVIAEEVGAVVPELVTYEDNGRDARGVDYSRLTALLIEATKEQQALIHQQQQQIRGQQVQMKAQEAQIAQLSSQVKAIQVSLKASGRTGAEVLRTVKAQAPLVQQ
ncbi:MAG TPA: tail fiber domain-containing protein, partial [Terriglobales bacterium]|nr:tail fiber domain-containing protein [Terriglobales bacterium]